MARRRSAKGQPGDAVHVRALRRPARRDLVRGRGDGKPRPFGQRRPPSDRREPPGIAGRADHREAVPAASRGHGQAHLSLGTFPRVVPRYGGTCLCSPARPHHWGQGGRGTGRTGARERHGHNEERDRQDDEGERRPRHLSRGDAGTHADAQAVALQEGRLPGCDRDRIADRSRRDFQLRPPVRFPGEAIPFRDDPGARSPSDRDQGSERRRRGEAAAGRAEPHAAELRRDFAGAGETLVPIQLEMLCHGCKGAGGGIIVSSSIIRSIQPTKANYEQ